MWPPRPPSPPLGPPNSMNFSRRKLAAPAPPCPLWTQILAESRKRMAGARPEGRPAGCCWRLLGGLGHRLGWYRRLGGHHRDEHPAVALLELHAALDHRVDGVVAAEADVLAGVPLGAALADQDVARDHRLAAELLDAQALARGVAAVARTAACFLVCHGGCSWPLRRPRCRRCARPSIAAGGRCGGGSSCGGAS